jgi:hypothetical protein
VAAVAALLLAAGARAQTVTMEGVGRAPLGGTTRVPHVGTTPVPPGRAALDAALRDAVRKVAAGLAGAPAGRAGEAALDEALGNDPARYAPSYRTRSEREVKGASGGPELVVIVEAQVDRTRVAAALRRAGLLPDAAGAAPAAEGLQQIAIEPVPPWPALTALRRRFVELGARRAVLARVEPGRVVVAVEGRSADSLARAVVAEPPPGTQVEAAGESDGMPRLRLESAPLPAAAPAAPIDTEPAKR